MQGHLPPGITFAKSDNLEEWQMDIRVLDDNPLYQNQIYRLKFTFSQKYPIGTSPSFLSLSHTYQHIYKRVYTQSAMLTAGWR